MSQESSREVRICPCSACRQEPAGEEAQRHRDVNSLVVALDEKMRRRFVGLLAAQHGRGGFAHFSVVTGLSRNTIRRGLFELQHQEDESHGRIRRPGAGRQPVEKKAHTSAPR